MTIGKTIRQLREIKGLTQSELAKRVGINRNNISRKETGVTRVRQSEYALFAKAFGMKTDEFVSEVYKNENRPDTPAMVLNLGSDGAAIGPEDCSKDPADIFSMRKSDVSEIAVIMWDDSMEPSILQDDVLLMSVGNVENEAAMEEHIDGHVCWVWYIDEDGMGASAFGRVWTIAGELTVHRDNRLYRTVALPQDAVVCLAMATMRKTTQGLGDVRW